MKLSYSKINKLEILKASVLCENCFCFFNSIALSRVFNTCRLCWHDSSHFRGNAAGINNKYYNHYISGLRKAFRFVSKRELNELVTFSFILMSFKKKKNTV